MIVLLLVLLLPAYASATDSNTVTFGKITVNRTTQYLDMDNVKVTDYNAFMAFLDQLPNLKICNMFATEIKLADADRLAERYPGVKWGFSLRVAAKDHYHIIRSDSTAYCCLHNNKTVQHTSKDFEVLKYCPDMLALDLGHNAIEDISFLRYMPKLKVLILACNKLTDITPIGELTELEYLEIFKNNITDISPLANCRKLLDLNICFNRIKDWSVLYDMTQLTRLWLYNSNNYSDSSPVSSDVVSKLKKNLSNTQVDAKSYSTAGGWRSHTHYDTLTQMFYTDKERGGIHGNGSYYPFVDSWSQR